MRKPLFILADIIVEFEGLIQVHFDQDDLQPEERKDRERLKALAKQGRKVLESLGKRKADAKNTPR